MLLLGLFAYSAIADAQDLRRVTVWDLKLGQPISAQPSPDDFQGFACGADGGPPRRQLTGWGDFKRCAPEANGLREVYFEYDDEHEYVARAKNLPREIARWAGTAEAGFPVMVSALVDDKGVVRGLRIVTDSRPDHRSETVGANLRKRADAYLFGGFMAARHGIDAARDCTTLPAAEGETAIGTLFVKQSCELADAARGVKISLRVSYFRKPGQSGVNPQLPTQLTQGQFESSTRFEMYQLDPS
ncbi:MAG TPA: hypothetical protein VKD43_07230 [Xanthobacteraceae bacterium]|nr:hypothetical protein [Xanthobacteraceae bacterium]